MKTRTKGVIALFILAFVFASFGIFIRYLNTNFSIFQQLYLRLFLATLFTYCIFFKDIRLKRLIHMPKKDKWLITMRAADIYLFASTLNISAFISTKYSNVSFLQAIPTTAILGMFFLQEKPTRNKFLIIALSFIGVLFITVKDAHHLFTIGQGEIYALIADFFYSFFYISRKWHTNYLNNKELTFIILLLSSVFLFIASLIFDRSFPLTGWTMNYVVAIVVVAILVVINMFLINYGFQYVEPFLANNIIALESVIAASIGFLLYKEILTLPEVIGSLLILISVPLMNKEETEKT
jgi:drug/metabolite transporter (DMT)-like permease